MSFISTHQYNEPQEARNELKEIISLLIELLEDGEEDNFVKYSNVLFSKIGTTKLNLWQMQESINMQNQAGQTVEIISQIDDEKIDEIIETEKANDEAAKSSKKPSSHNAYRNNIIFNSLIYVTGKDTLIIITNVYTK